ncbi:MAG: septum formation protein Maf [Bacteroidia bacterium]|nr:septum formation protein Maf [Bacteroidia bacterium]
MLQNKLISCNIILASRSPRRQYLLKELGIEFEIRIKEEHDETYPQSLTKEQIPVYLAEVKAKTFINELTANDLLITADTIVWLDGEIINKPSNYEEAVNMLNKLSGKMHQVVTGVCLTSLKKTSSFHVVTDVYFKKLSEEEIRYYVENFRPYDKAGAYGIQEWLGYIGIERIDGCYFNVMGLPLQKLYEGLRFF